MKLRIIIEILTIIYVLSTQSLIAQIPTFEWANQMGGGFNDTGASITVDTSGNAYITGNFEGTADFDPGSEIFNLTSSGGSDVFIQKLDSVGNFLWAKQIGGTSDDYGASTIIDVYGNAYTIGSFMGTVDFDPGQGTVNLTSVADYDIFIQKLDFNGDFLFAKQLGGASNNYGNSISVDILGNICTTGSFLGTLDLDPGTGIYNLTSAGDYDSFVLKLDSDGNFLWAKQMGGTFSDEGFSIAVDGFGNIYSTGYFQGTADFDPSPGIFNLTSTGLDDIYIQKLDPNGNFVWAKRMGGTLFDKGFSIALDISGNIFTTGGFGGTADFDPGSETFSLTSAGDFDIFILKLDTDGSFLWAKQMGGISMDVGFAIAVDAAGSAYTTGHFRETVDFDSGSGTFSLTSTGNSNIFVHKLDANGGFLWAKRMGGTSYAFGTSIAVDAFENIYTTGYFNETLDFGPETVSFISVGSSDIFVQKLSQLHTLDLNKLENDLKLIVYPNPSSNIINIEFENSVESVEIKITDTQGKIIFETEFRNTAKASIELNEAAGIYLLSIRSKGGQKTIQLIKK